MLTMNRYAAPYQGVPDNDEGREEGPFVVAALSARPSEPNPAGHPVPCWVESGQTRNTIETCRSCDLLQHDTPPTPLVPGRSELALFGELATLSLIVRCART